MKIGFDFPATPRKTALFAAEEWYNEWISQKLGREKKEILRSNFGEYSMAVNYTTSVLEEAKAVEKVAVYNIDHMAQIEFSGVDAEKLLDRVLPTRISEMKIGQCKYTLLLSQEGTVIDDLIVMRRAKDNFILVINAGHDITDVVEENGQRSEWVADADWIAKYKQGGENVQIQDVSDQWAKIDVQGPYCFRVIKDLYGEEVLKNRNKPDKNMRFFTFNEFDFEGHHYMISRTGYTNRWGFELYVPVAVAEEQLKRIVEKAVDLGGLFVGLGGRDENRISAGAAGLPLNGSEYSRRIMPLNAPLFNAAIDMSKEDFVGKKALEAGLAENPTKTMVVIISEGIVSGRGVYRDGKRLGSVTSSINSPNVPEEKRNFIGSKRKSVNGPDGTAAIGIAWLYDSPFEKDENGEPILEKDGKPVWIPVEFYREDENRNLKGRAVLGFIAADGVNPATAPLPLKKIAKL